MPFNTRAGFKLALAVAAAISAQTLRAEDNPERLWSCNLTPSGDWDCEVNEALARQPAQTPRDGDQEVAPDTEREPVRIEPAESAVAAQPEAPTSRQEPRPEAAADSAPPVEIAAPAAVDWPKPPEVQPKPQTALSAPANGTDWNCVAQGDSWDCQQQAGQQTGATRSTNTRTLAAGKPEWDCTASGGDWDCKQVPGAAPAAQPLVQSPTAPLTPASAAALDWYAYAPGEAPGACRGRYVEPELAFLEDERPLDQQPVYIDALSSSTVLDGITTLEGGIQIQRGGRLISSTRGEYDRQSSQARLFGEVKYRERGFLLRGEQADADMLSGDTRFHNAQYVMHQEHMRGQARQITRFGDSRVRLDEGAVTYCEPGSNAWQLAAKSIELDPETGRGVARHATLDVAGVPVLYTPYLSFPIDDRRQSGFLYPSIRYSVSDGIDLSVPYYFNIAPNLDDTLTPRYIGERGLLLENELRYMNAWSHNSLSTAILADDSQYNGDRWLLGFEHQGTLKQNLSSRIDFTRVSDDDYFEDLGTSLDVQRDDHLDQLLELNYRQPNWALSFRTQGYQTIDGTTPYERLPQIRLTGFQPDLAGGLNASYEAEYVRFERNLESRYAPGSDAGHTVGSRVHLRPRVSYALEQPWGFVRSAATLWHSSYDLENDRDSTLGGSQSISAGIVSLDTGLVFERDYELGDGTYTQTLEPRLFLLHAEADKQFEVPTFDSSQLSFTYSNLFHETGWSGNDRVADTTQATLGLSSAIYSRQGIEKLRVGVAQAHYFADREYAGRPGDSGDTAVTQGNPATNSSSNLATLANWNFTRNLRLTHNGEVDRDSYEFLEHNYKLSYRPGDRRLFYLSYRDNIEKRPNDGNQQLDMAFRWPLSNQWTGYGRWQQDLDANENLDTLLGIEYSSCCWKVRLTGRRWVVDPDSVGSNEAFETDTGIFLQFVLRGLGSFGQGEGSDYLKEITGYDEDDDGTF
ncbi:LPS assembly protein LptD [Marinobacterium sp. AK62]|uniref:LPS-assembly protein LptD n=1 Tax=Marinobacterium alkalitolerans TaxID=1542925 RepID=A0ABS3ZAY9_9GAMM|nr:LPS assembly protein LptD [Marinobacterium alkalitolerans]MBP0048819.1 LPS assembly protein LptD [Marinobacterium alkalitolerans]